LLRASDRIGLIQEGREANLLLVDGNPLKDIKQIESVQAVFLKGGRIDRAGLFDQQ
jgi:imidazolonepropionase-like amidohydrolase